MVEPEEQIIIKAFQIDLGREQIEAGVYIGTIVMPNDQDAYK